MWYRLLADVVVVVHAGFLAYVVLGGFFGLWRLWALIPHAAAAGWGLFVVTASVDCPLTTLENTLRRRGGETGLGSDGFIDTYVEGVLYPERHAVALQVLAGAVALISWTAVLWWARTRPRPPEPLGDNS